MQLFKLLKHIFQLNMDFIGEKIKQKAKIDNKQFRIIHHVDKENLDKFYKEYSPVFILSTGRSGSKFISEICNLSNDLNAFHEPSPTLMFFPIQAYHQNIEILKQIINASRMELMLNSFIKDKIYVESNQCLSFYSYALAELFPKAKFIHIVRHPGDFIRSSIRKGWHKNDSIWEIGRIKESNKEWMMYDQIEKLAWTWKETNNYLVDFGASLLDNRYLLVKFEDLSSNLKTMHDIFRFIGTELLQDKVIKKMQNKKINELQVRSWEPENMRKRESYLLYSDWREEDKSKTKRILGSSYLRYGYKM